MFLTYLSRKTAITVATRHIAKITMMIVLSVANEVVARESAYIPKPVIRKARPKIANTRDKIPLNIDLLFIIHTSQNYHYIVVYILTLLSVYFDTIIP